MDAGQAKKVYTFGTNQLEVPQRYDVQKVIGRGAYGIVCSAVDITTGDRVAIKKIGGVFDDLVDGKRILREVKLLGFLKHQNILGLKDLFRPKDPEHFTDLYFVTDYMDTDLHQVLKSKQIRLVEEHCQYFIYQLLCGLHYIHSAGVLHRDLKPANLLTNGDCDLRICDFGLSRGRGVDMTEYVVTRWYRPPELLLISVGYNCAIDLWAVGCLAAEVLTRKPLFPGRDYIHQINIISDLLGVPDQNDLRNVKSEEALQYVKSMPKKPPSSLQRTLLGASSQLLDFISKLLVYDPEKRLTAQQAMQHPWLEAFYDASDVIEAPQTFNWDYDSSDLGEGQLRKLLWNEITKFSVS
jgi:serine/threonine protein kinase